MYSRLYRGLRMLWPGGIETRRHLRELEITQWLSRAALQEWQLARIQRLLRYAYENVPYYRDLFLQLGTHPADIRSLADFQALPFLTKEIINSNLDALVSPAMRRKAQLQQTGGSTGQPTRLFIEKSYWWWDAALEFRGRAWHGVHEGDKIAFVWGAHRDMYDWSRPARIKAKVQQHRYLNAFAMSEAKMLEFAELLLRWQPDMIRAYASALQLFARFLNEHDITGIRPKVIETTAEKLAGDQRDLIEEVFHCKIADWYSARELGTIGFECEAGGLHVCETRFLEIVANDHNVEPGRMGEVVITSLNQFAMPLIRYKMQDMAIYETAPCSCGRGMPVLREILGRTDDYLVTANGEFVYGGFFRWMFMVNPSIVRFQVYQPDKQRLELQLACKRPLDPSYVREIETKVRAKFGPGVHIEIHFPDQIELTPAGKHRAIISAIRPEFVS